VLSTMATTSARSAAGLCQVVHERVPLTRRDAQVPVRVLHVLAAVFLRTSGGQAQHLRNEDADSDVAFGSTETFSMRSQLVRSCPRTRPRGAIAGTCGLGHERSLSGESVARVERSKTGTCTRGAGFRCAQSGLRLLAALRPSASRER
jgi:hypothetical protein